jgi:hypothetical protein
MLRLHFSLHSEVIGLPASSDHLVPVFLKRLQVIVSFAGNEDHGIDHLDHPRKKAALAMVPPVVAPVLRLTGPALSRTKT